MSNCVQNFRSIFNKLARSTKQDTGGAYGLFSSFAIGQEANLEKNLSAVINTLTDAALNENAKDNSITNYDFKSAENRLIELSETKLKDSEELKFPLLTRDVIDEIMLSLKNKINRISENTLTNPLIRDANGDEAPLFDTSNMSRLLRNIEPMEIFLERELDAGIMKSIFINIWDSSVGNEDAYESFVVTDLALNKNIKIYKNELWAYIVGASGLTAADIVGTQLYSKGKLNESLFIKDIHGHSPYTRVLTAVKNKMEQAFETSNYSEKIRIFPSSGFSTSQAFIKAIILANFDNFLVDKQGDKIKVNFDSAATYGLPTNNNEKYSLNFTGLVSKHWAKEQRGSSVDEHSTSLVRTLADIIPLITRKVKNGVESWSRTRTKLTLGKSNLDAVGPLINSLPQTFQISVRYGTGPSSYVKDINIGKAFSDYDAGKLEFEQILKGLIDKTRYNDDLGVSEVNLRSIYEFLYNPTNGVNTAFRNWAMTNTHLMDGVKNIEMALVNHMRMTVGNVYRNEDVAPTYKTRTRTVDAIHVNSKTGQDFETLANNIYKQFSGNKTILMKDGKPLAVTNIGEYVEFLSTYGDFQFSPTVIEEFARKFGDPASSTYIDFSTDGFKRAFESLTKLNNGVIVTYLTDEGTNATRSQNVEERIDHLQTTDVNNYLRLKDLFKTMHRSETYGIVTTIIANDGSVQPTMGVSNLSTLFTTALEKSPKSFFANNNTLFNGVEILAEVVGKEDEVINVEDLYHNELFKLSFVRHFIMSGINEDKYLIQPWNYSDKIRIYGVAINSKGQVINTATKQLTSLQDMTSQELKDEMFRQQQKHYNLVVNKMYVDFQKLDPTAFKAETNTLTKLKTIEKYLDTVGSFKNLQAAVAKVFERGEYLEMVRNLHYTVYNTPDGKKVKVNQFLKANVMIYNDKDKYFKTWTEKVENKLAKYVGDSIKITFGELNLKSASSVTNKVKEIKDKFKLKDGDFEVEINTEYPSKSVLKIASEGQASELLKKFIWTKNLIVSQYANTTVKDAALHNPGKNDFENIDLNSDASWDTYFREESQRSTTFTKRMNIAGASMMPYGKGRSGIGQTMKVAITSDPAAQSFNFTGESKDQDTMDGGGKINPFMTEQLIASLPGMEIGKTQKPIAESLNETFATTLKFATFGITNEEIRLSVLADHRLDAMMFKINNIDIYNDDNKGLDVFKISDPKGNLDTFDHSVIAADLYVPFNGTYYKLYSVTHTGGNNYTIQYADDNGNLSKDGVPFTKNVKIKNLHDIWNVYGGALSASKVGGQIIHNEASIKIVSSLIKKHSMFGQSKFDLKNSMIGMVLPESAVKKGATNINNVNVWKNKSALAYFNFDTTFFGIQLDASHEVDEEEINEVSQAISAAAENASTPELYQDLYNAISTIVENDLNKFKRKAFDHTEKIKVKQKDGTTTLEDVIVPGTIQKIVDSFVKNLGNSKQINNSKLIIDSIVDDLEQKRILEGATTAGDMTIPFGNKTIYKQFVSHIVSKLNSTYIKRAFPGLGAVLNPSQGIIQVFESKTGKVYMAPDLLLKINTKKAEPTFNAALTAILQNPEVDEFEKMRQQLELVLSTSVDEFGDDQVGLNEIKPLDFVKLDRDITLNKKEYKAGEIISLNKIEDYYSLKEQLKAEPANIARVYTVARDLKPVTITYNNVVKTKNAAGEEVRIATKTNIFDADALQFKWWLELNKKGITSGKIQSAKLDHFIEFISTVDPTFKALEETIATTTDSTQLIELNKIKVDAINTYAKKWVERTFQLIEAGVIFKNYEEFDATTENPFLKIFKYDTKEKDATETKLDNLLFGFKKQYRYKEVNFVYDYKHSQAETVLGKRHKSTFLLGEEPLSSIDKLSFERKLRNFTKVHKKGRYDVILMDYHSGTNLNTILIHTDVDPAHQAYREDKGILYDNKTGQSIGKKMYINVEAQEDGSMMRRTTFGEDMYQLPKDYTFYKDEDGHEIMVVRSYKDESNIPVSAQSSLFDFIKNTKAFNMFRVNDYYHYKSNLKSEDSRDSLIELYEGLIDATSERNLRNYLRARLKEYKVYKNANKEAPAEEVRVSYANGFVRNEEALDDYVNNLRDVLYESWKKSNESLASRIPAQAMQSSMSMKTIGYLQQDTNDVYVSHWQLWLQGSDLDIDKVYIMMYGFNKGVFAGWSPYFDMKQWDLSEQLPLPNNKRYALVEDTKKSTLDISSFKFTAAQSELQRLVVVLKYLAAHPEITDIKANDINEKTGKSYLVERINKHNAYSNTAGIKNFIVNKLIRTSDNPKNQVASYTPISFGKYDAIKERAESEYSLSLLDGHTMFYQQEQNIIGKKVIGIAATGLKDYFAMVNYYANIYAQGQPTEIDNAFFLRTFNINGKHIAAFKISGLNLEEKASILLRKKITELLTLKEGETIAKKTGGFYTQDELNEIVNGVVNSVHDTDAALTISSLLSLATDNAKELMLAKINAGIDFAGMHIYLMMVGVDEGDIAEYMTSPQAKKIKSKLNQDFFASGTRTGTDKTLNNLVKKSYTQLVAAKKQLALNPGDVNAIAEIKKHEPQVIADEAKSGINQEFLAEFLRIKSYSSELIALGGFFKVNQGVTSTQEAIDSITLQLEKTITVRKLQYFNALKFTPAELEQSALKLKKTVDFIINEKPYLQNNRQYVIDTLTWALTNGIHNDGGRVDANKYFDDAAYRAGVTAYYNLIKGSLNVLDIVNNSPHYYSMLKAFQTGQKALVQHVNKFKFSKEAIELLFNVASELREYSLFDIDQQTRIYSNKNGGISLSDTLWNKSNDLYDTLVIGEFVKSLNYKLHIPSIMTALGLTTIDLMDDNKQEIKINAYAATNLPFEEIDMATEYGAAQFKYLMETQIIPYLKKTFPTNGFLKNYKYSRKVYNMKNRVGYYLDKSNFDDMEDVILGVEALSNRNTSKYDLEIKSVDNTIENAKSIDLLFLYDLLINQGRFGGNRATTFYSRDIKDPNSLSKKFVQFQIEQDDSKTFLEDINTKIKDPNNKAYREMLLFELFSSPVKDGNGRQVTLHKEANNHIGPPSPPIVLGNYHYTVIESLAGAGRVSTLTTNLVNDLMSSIKDKLLTIDINCK